ncbi:SMI1/KNR4 family protein [Paenibacillus lactis]|uniref:Cell wall assembly/cell proliferation coordinating protein, KNR4-like protein n=1 Tax=Paenibacillus lactis 154 TaxID=743719 RepID=G4HJ03_9BACL|nr:SMI1/KNR4 family protein [Paenibacillus lactis]EHB62721.1 Cell wall assembly/cell proliferation coordinating protein, KNR4-like protein [Paenibacillus lactis 154]
MKATIEGLLRVLGEHHKEAHGIPEADIQVKEQSLGLGLPVVLRDYYKNLGRSPYITQGCNNQYEPLPLQDVFIPDETFFTTDKAFLVFYQVEESVIYCGIRIQDLEKEDPPVYLCAWNSPDWQLENRSLQHFLAGKAFVQLGVEDRLPYWAIFDESMWGLSDYCRSMHLEREHEIDEGSELNAWKIYVKDDVLIVFELYVSEEETDDVLAVYLASFERASLGKLLSGMGRAANLPAFRSNLSES